MNTKTAHFHTTASCEGLRQCTDPRCGAWTLDGRNWALSPETLTFVQDPYPGARAEQNQPVMPAMIALEPVAA